MLQFFLEKMVSKKSLLSLGVTKDAPEVNIAIIGPDGVGKSGKYVIFLWLKIPSSFNSCKQIWTVFLIYWPMKKLSITDNKQMVRNWNLGVHKLWRLTSKMEVKRLKSSGTEI